MRIDKLTVVWTGAVLAATAGFLWVDTRPQVNQLYALADRARADQVAQQSDEQDLQAVQALQREVDALVAQAADFEARIPEQQMLGAFLEELARLAEARELRPDRVEPGKPVPSKNVVALPIAFRVSGPFPAVCGLIQDIGRMPRLTQIERFQTEINKDDPGKVSAEVGLNVFFQAS